MCDIKSKLLSCPFCDGDAFFDIIELSGKFKYRVECNLCPATIETHMWSKKVAAEYWNKRTGKDTDE